jgi:hypothetical protein
MKPFDEPFVTKNEDIFDFVTIIVTNCIYTCKCMLSDKGTHEVSGNQTYLHESVLSIVCI